MKGLSGYFFILPAMSADNGIKSLIPSDLTECGNNFTVVAVWQKLPDPFILVQTDAEIIVGIYRKAQEVLICCNRIDFLIKGQKNRMPCFLYEAFSLIVRYYREGVSISGVCLEIGTCHR